MGAIQTNEIKYEFNYEAFGNAYDIFCVGVHVPREDKKFFAGTRMLDKPETNNKILAILFAFVENSRVIYILMKHDPNNQFVLRDILRDDAYFEHITIKKVDAKDIAPSHLLQLCLNGITHNPDAEDECEAWNLTGKLMLFAPGLIETDKNGKFTQIHTIQLRVSYDMKLLLNVVTLTKLSMFPNLDVHKRYPNGCVYYKLDTTPTFVMRRMFSPSNEDDKVYIQRQYKNTKCSVPFLNTVSYDKFLSCKMGILYSALRMLEKQYSGMVRIWFSEVSDFKTISPVPSETRATEKKAYAYFSGKNVVLSNKTGDASIGEDLMELRDVLEEEYACRAIISDVLSAEDPNIVVIHDKEFYEMNQLEDPYKDLAKGKRIIQRLSDDTLKKIINQIRRKKCRANEKIENGKKLLASDRNYSLLRNLFYQIIIKEDIRNGSFTLCDWMFGKMQFKLRCMENGENDRIIEMNVSENGCFEIAYKNPVKTSCLDEPLDYDMHGKEMEIVSGNNVYTIDSTGWYTIPNIFGIAERIKNKDTKIRNKRMREELFKSCIDINVFPLGETRFAYFVGEKGNGLNQSIQDAANIRVVTIEEGTGNIDFFEKNIMPMFNVSFVRNNQLTVFPFVFKYMREWLEMFSKETG